MSIALVGCALLALGATIERTPDAAALLREGDAQYAAGAFAAAAELYQQSAERSDDPGPATYNQALAAYRLATSKETPDPKGLRESAVLFRCCLGADDPRRTRALLGLGNCLLNSPPGRDGENLREAIISFRLCIKESDSNSTLAAKARHNLELALLRFAQLQQAATSSDDDPGSDKEPRGRQPRLPVPMTDNGDTEGMTETTNPDGSQKGDPQKGDKTGPMGKGDSSSDPVRQPNSPDKNAPRSANEANDLLEKAVLKIVADRLENLLKSQRPVPDQVEDW